MKADQVENTLSPLKKRRILERIIQYKIKERQTKMAEQSKSMSPTREFPKQKVKKENVSLRKPQNMESGFYLGPNPKQLESYSQTEEE